MSDHGANSARNTAGLRPPWKPGQSGNPSGRPKRQDAFRALCRDVTEGAVSELRRRLTEEPKSIKLPLLLEAIMVLASHSGYVTSAGEIERAKVLAELVKSNKLNPQQMQTLVDAFAAPPHEEPEQAVIEAHGSGPDPDVPPSR